MSSYFEKHQMPHARQATSVRRGGKYLPREQGLEVSNPLLLQREKRDKQLLPQWDEEGNKGKAIRTLRKQNPAEAKVGITEFMHQKMQRYEKFCGGHVEDRFEVATRPVGFIGLSSDDCFVRTVPFREVIQRTTPAAAGAAAAESSAPDCEQHEQRELKNRVVRDVSVSADLSKNCTEGKATSLQLSERPRDVPELVESSEPGHHGSLEIAPVEKARRTFAVFFCRVSISAGTTPEAIVEFFRSRVQSARHSAITVARSTGDDVIVPCHVRLEPTSGFALAPVGAAMQVIVRVRTWMVAGEDILKRSIAAAGAWHTVKHGGRLKLLDVWSLEEYKNSMHRCSDPPTAVDSSLAPVVEYTVLVRGSESGLASVLDQCRRVRDKGFINFTSLYSFGQPAHYGSLRFARAFLQGRYTDALLAHASLLARTSAAPAVPALQQLRGRLMAVDDGGSSSSSSSSATQRNLKFEWATAQRTVASVLEEEKHTCRVAKARAEDVDLEPLHKLNELLQHVVSAGGDCESVLRDGIAVPKTVVQWHLRSLSDLHFNTLASIRIRKHGADKVVPGDVVFLGESSAAGHLDFSPLSMPPAFGVPTCSSVVFERRQESPAKWWKQELGDSSAPSSSTSLLHVVRSESEAAQFDVAQIVLPRWGWWDPSQNEGEEIASQLPFPTATGVDRDAFDSVSRLLHIPPGAPFLKTAPGSQQIFPPAQAYYRPLVVKPPWLDAHCWDSRVGLDLPLEAAAASTSSTAAAAAASMLSTEEDAEGLRRLVIPDLSKECLVESNHQHLPRIRPAIRDRSAARAALLATIPAGAQSAGRGGAVGSITTALRIALPATAAFSSAVREIFRLETVSPFDVSRLVHQSVQDSWRKQKIKMAESDRRARQRAIKHSLEL